MDAERNRCIISTRQHHAVHKFQDRKGVAFDKIGSRSINQADLSTDFDFGL